MGFKRFAHDYLILHSEKYSNLTPPQIYILEIYSFYIDQEALWLM